MPGIRGLGSSSSRALAIFSVAIGAQACVDLPLFSTITTTYSDDCRRQAVVWAEQSVGGPLVRVEVDCEQVRAAASPDPEMLEACDYPLEAPAQCLGADADSSGDATGDTVPEAGPTDAATDGTSPDTGPSDAGADTTAQDAAADHGLTDGLALDGGPATDAGSDAGSDAGPDAGPDAGCAQDCDLLDDACNDYACVQGGCVATALPGACNDGDPCTHTDICSDGVCGGTTKECGEGCATCGPLQACQADYTCVDVCDGWACGTDQGVSCGTCDPGSACFADEETSSATCEPVLCGTDEYVEQHVCVPCPLGWGNPAGDDASGPDTLCEPVLCGTDEYVEQNICVPCPLGWGNPAGDDASGPDTLCDDPCWLAFGVTCDDFEQGYLKASNTDNFGGDRFGRSVALDGDTLAVGAYEEDSAATGVGGDQADNTADVAGAVYVFVRDGAGGWSQQAYLKASNTDGGDYFGRSVALSGDTLAVGANGEASAATGVGGDQADNTADGAGAVYVFVRDGAGGWSQQAYLKASNTDGSDSFGSSVALDGDTLAVGAHGEDSAATGVGGDQADNTAGWSGAVYVFVRDGAGGWSQQAYLKASNTDGSDYFGSSVALSGDTLAVGAYGEDSAATGVGGDQADNTADVAGAVYVFVRDGAGGWSQQAYLKASNTDGSDYFGSSVALSGDTLAVGAYGEDSAATGVGGDQADNTADVAGAVYVFVRDGAGGWSQQAYLKASNTDGSDSFGSSVALDGDTLAVGAHGEDSAATGVGGDQADNTAGWSGAVYVFVRDGAGGWSQQAYRKASNTDGGDQFGASVALDGDTLAVGAYGEASAATGVGGDQADNTAGWSGAVYVRKIAP